MSEYVLEMKNIYKSFGGIHALTDVTLQLKRGEVLCLCGENGAGKSTLMKILSGVEMPTKGQIFINDKEVNITRPIEAFEAGVSIVHQELIQIPQMTVAENIFLGRLKSKTGFVDYADLRKKTLELMERLNIHYDPDSLIKNYSVAQRQLIEIMKALSYNSSIIVFDEPTAALTQDETNVLYGIIKQLKADGISIIFISHRMDDIFAVGDRIQVLRDGTSTGTADLSDISVDDIVKMMIGRQMKQQFPEKTNRVGDVIFKAEHLTNERIKDVSMELRKGEILGIGGLVGSGRTELLRAIFGADTFEGEMMMDGEKIVNDTPAVAIRRGFALVPEDRKDQGLILTQSILQNVILSILSGLSKFGIQNREEERKVTDKYIKELRIKTPNSSLKVNMLSGGNQQKVVLGKCLASNPKILLLDEPTRGVDVGAKAEIYKIINDIASLGVSIVVVSSEMEELIGISDRIIVMHEGHISGEIGAEDACEESIMKLAITH
ncbi:sugar ABC transporter ATP-binding protein [Caproiciproducens sp. R1]|uniref:sugar ABC transporter ATP-binding protein n=1 Tax=Caproiciproducens sp. R1 TaxID=3435000 RepID=UPI0040341868